MVRSLKIPEIYASQLVHLRYGHPLWYPEPEESGEVDIGDVGYITDGTFNRLFNARYDPNHEKNKNGVPENFDKLLVSDEDISERKRMVEPGTSLVSDSVRKVEINASAGLPAYV